jgi:hypothetical protein
MAWDSEPPKKSELLSLSAGWDAEPPKPEELKKTSPLVSGVRKFVQGGSAGFSDELAGAVEGAGKVVGLKGLGGPMKDIKIDEDGPSLKMDDLRAAYRRARDKERDSLKKDSAENPSVSGIAELGGAVLSPVNKIMPGSSIAKQGAAIGAITGLGGSEGEDLAETATDVATGGLLGGAIGKVADKASPLIQRASVRAKDVAERIAAKALGAERGSLKKIGLDRAKEAGRQALDNGLISPFNDTDKMISKNAALKGKGAGKMNEVYKTIDDAGASTVNPQKLAEKVNEELGGFWRSPINKSQSTQLDNTLESILVRGDNNIPMKEAQALKEELKKVANWEKKLDLTDKERMARDAYKIVSNAIDESADAGAKTVGKAGLGDTLKEGKKIYGNAKTAERFLKNKSDRENGNNFISLTDFIAGGGAASYGGATGDWEGAAGGLVAKKALQKYGAQTAALSADKIAKTLARIPKYAGLLKKNPAEFQAIVKNLEQQSTGGLLPRAAENESNKKNRVSEK